MLRLRKLTSRTALARVLLTCLILLSFIYSLRRWSSASRRDYSFARAVFKNPKICQETQQRLVKLTDYRPKNDLQLSQSAERANISGWTAANRLLDGCWTYQERYGRLQTLPESYTFLPECRSSLPASSHNETAFVIRMSENQRWSQDFTNAIRAIIVEVGWTRGMDIFILQHISSHKTFQYTSIPLEFRPFTKQFTLSETVALYDPEVIRPIKRPPRELPVMAQFNHLAETHFMRLFPQYSYAWFVEGDTRAMGPWHLFLADIDAKLNGTMHDEGVDLLTLTPSYRMDMSWPWGPSLHQFPNGSMTASLLQTHRISRRMSDAMHEEHLKGRNAYHELFVPTVATLHGLTKFIYANPVFSDSVPPFTGMPFTGIAEVNVADATRLQMRNLSISNTESGVGGQQGKIYHGATYSPVDTFSVRYYREWMRNDTICRPLSLVHPIKT